MGNVREQSLADIVVGDRFRCVRDELAEHFQCRPTAECEPKWCDPYNAGCHPECNPSCSPRCNPISCRPTCLPPR
ncbi:hypothetical protein [Actinophytocola sp.]|uniref:hypothetical protein n=1 Tax=Actinophytocola sp. TaxID=1872138 RepID=UPI003D6B2AB9